MVRAFAAFWLMLLPLVAAAADLRQAEELLRAGRANDAYRLLAADEIESAGEPEFDYLLGVAALEAGKPAAATLIFERVLAVSPSHAAARLDMGRAYFALGDYERAANEFDIVLRFNPPLAARLTVERYQALIADRLETRRTRVSGFAEASAGHDTNVNLATAQGLVYLPLFNLNFELAPGSRKQRDDYVALGGGVLLERALGSGWGVFGAVEGRQRDNMKANAFDNTTLEARAGMQHAIGPRQLRLTASYNTLDLGRAHYRDVAGLNGEWRYARDAHNHYTLYLQYSEARYAQTAMQGNNVDTNTAGVGWIHAWDARPGVVLHASAFGGEERDPNGRADGAKRFLGLRFGGQMPLAQGVEAFASLTWQDGRYSRQNLLFSDTRHDRQWDASLGVMWNLTREWTLRPALNLTRVNSNLPLYDYSRYELSLSLRRDFR